MKRSLARAAVILIVAAGLAACAARSAYKRGSREAQEGNWDAAVVHYTRAVREEPDNIEYRIALQRALIQAGAFHLKEAQKRLAAEDLEGALEELQLATQLDPSNRYAQEELDETRRKLQERKEAQRQAASFEERRARAITLRRTLPESARDLGALDTAAIERVREEAWPQPR
ncbi:MAG: hypothetical protein ACE5JI_09225, partial [Acidobacteriota bacterium]